MRRVIALSTLLIMVLLVLSASLAEAQISHLPRRHFPRRHLPRVNHTPTSNIILCALQGLNCSGTPGNDILIDQPNATNNIFGSEGVDGYIEFSGSSLKADTLEDISTTSSDYYLIENRNFNIRAGDALVVLDAGGPLDTLDLSPTGYISTICPPTRVAAASGRAQNDLLLSCPGTDDIVVLNYFSSDSIEFFKFADGTFTIPKSSITSQQSQGQLQTSTPDTVIEHSSSVVSQAESTSSLVSMEKQSEEVPQSNLEKRVKEAASSLATGG